MARGGGMMSRLLDDVYRSRARIMRFLSPSLRPVKSKVGSVVFTSSFPTVLLPRLVLDARKVIQRERSVLTHALVRGLRGSEWAVSYPSSLRIFSLVFDPLGHDWDQLRVVQIPALSGNFDDDAYCGDHSSYYRPFLLLQGRKASFPGSAGYSAFLAAPLVRPTVRRVAFYTPDFVARYESPIFATFIR